MPEPLIRLLAELPPAEPDAARAERTRPRCRARFQRRARRAARRPWPARAAGRAQLWQPLIAVLGVVYLTEALVQAIRFYGLFLD